MRVSAALSGNVTVTCSRHHGIPACALEDIPDINVHDVARIAEQLPDSNLFKTNLLCLAHLSSKATDTLWVDRTEATQVSPAPRNIKTLINRIKSLHDEMHGWLPAE